MPWANRWYRQSGRLRLPWLLAIVLVATACAAETQRVSIRATSAEPAEAQLPPQEPASPTVIPTSTLAPTWTTQPTIEPSVETVATPTPTTTATPLSLCDQPGQIERGRFPSALSPPDSSFRIYLPPCYGQDGRVYPVLFMLPGNIHDDSIWDQLGLDEAAEQAINDGLIPPLLIVMPEGGQLAMNTSGGPYSYEALILNDLLPYIESNYCAWSNPMVRAIGGLSRGGYWALEIAFRNPSQFASVGGHSAALVDTFAGPELDPKYTALTADLSTLRIYLDAGDRDWYLPQLHILHDNLLAAGKDHTWAIQEGSHENAYWSAHVADYLLWYAAPWSQVRDVYPPCMLTAR